MRGLVTLLTGSIIFAAVSSSTNYKLQDYGVNSGGTNNSASATYKTRSSAGGLNGSVSSGTTYKLNSGSISVEQSNVPPAPTLSNGFGTYYNKLGFTINTGNNPTDATFAVAVSTTSNFSSVSYVQADGTLGSSVVYRTYSAWGGSSGSLATDLLTNTTYYFKVAAQTGAFTTSGFGPSANIATASPSLTFSVSPSSVDFGNLNAGSVASQAVSFSFDTNAGNGGNIYMAGTSSGLFSQKTGYTLKVADPTGDLSSLGDGFGFQGTGASAPLSIQAPYNTSSNTVGIIYTSFVPVFSATSPVSGGTATADLKAKSSSTTPSSSDYQNTLTFVAATVY